MTNTTKAMEFTRSLAGRVHNEARARWNVCRPRTKLGIAAVPLTTVAVSLFVVALVSPSKTWANNDDEISTFTVDVAMDAVNVMQNDVDPSEGQAVFSPGDTFIQEGTIYPAGTIPSGQTNFDPDAPGGIGRIRVRGAFTTDSANFEKAVNHLPGANPVVALVSEIYSFDDEGTTIMTDGIWPNANFSARRVVLGGTGKFREIVGESKEENLGENMYGFCNFRVTFHVKKLTR